MSRTSEARQLTELWADAMAEFDTIQSAVRDVRLQCLQDRRFYSIAGAQWEGDWGIQFENKPKLEINKVHLAVIRIINEYRNNRVTVDFTPTDGSSSDALADACDDLYRATEQRSVADEAYDNAFEEAVGGGFGAFRLTTEYENDEDPDDEKQRICIEPIYDADSCVFFDLNAKRQDKSDAKRCFVLTAYSPSAYKEEFKEDPASWPKDIYQSEFDWYKPDIVYVAEYYRLEEKIETLYVYKGLMGEERRITQEEIDEDRERDVAEDEENQEQKWSIQDELESLGFSLARTKQLKTRRVHKYLMSGGGVLEDCGLIAGKHIPVVPVYAKRWYIDDIERCMGHVRLAKDAQRLANMQRSKLAEISAFSTVEKPIFTPEQIAGHQVMWEEDNIKNYPYLLVNPVTDANGQQAITGPVAYTKVPQLAPAMAMLLQITEQDMKDLLGNQEAGEEIQPNISGKAVELIQNKLDMQSFIYMSNFKKAIKRAGEIWLGMAKDILIEPGRKLKGVGAQGETRPIELLRSVVDDNGAVTKENDFSKADFDVVPDVGPSSASRRQTTVRMLMGMISITDDPETKQVLGAMVMLNMEGEGISDVRDFFRKKLLRMGAIKPNDEEAKALAEELANEPPDPNAEYLKSAAKEADAKATEANAKTVLTIKQAEKAEADTELSRANALKALVEAGVTEIQPYIDLLDRFSPDGDDIGK